MANRLRQLEKAAVGISPGGRVLPIAARQKLPGGANFAAWITSPRTWKEQMLGSTKAKRLAQGRQNLSDDDGLLRATAGGDRAAFARLMERHARPMLALATRVTRNPDCHPTCTNASLGRQQKPFIVYDCNL